ncbi:MAG: hypothetical protein H3C43_10065, partial [Leptonema sp. (in: Bacteria)]|nr:hypothetical protein [Leptonema sp. (in: bacteria)]
MISVLGLLSCKQESSTVPVQLCNFQIGPCQTLLSDGTNLEFSISPHLIQPLTDLEFEV